MARAPSGHSEGLRDTLRRARKERGWSAQHVADLVAHEIGKASLNGQSIYYYEKFERHPPIDVFAAWARVLGHRLIVDLDRAEAERKPVLIRSERVREIAAALDDAPVEIQEAVFTIVNKMVLATPRT